MFIKKFFFSVQKCFFNWWNCIILAHCETTFNCFLWSENLYQNSSFIAFSSVKFYLTIFLRSDTTAKDFTAKVTAMTISTFVYHDNFVANDAATTITNRCRTGPIAIRRCFDFGTAVGLHTRITAFTVTALIGSICSPSWATLSLANGGGTIPIAS